jgi:hypothetical protein
LTIKDPNLHAHSVCDPLTTEARSHKDMVHFSADEKKPAEAGFSQDHVDSLSIAFLADGRSSLIPEHFLCAG